MTGQSGRTLPGARSAPLVRGCGLWDEGRETRTGPAATASELRLRPPRPARRASPRSQPMGTRGCHGGRGHRGAGPGGDQWAAGMFPEAQPPRPLPRRPLRPGARRAGEFRSWVGDAARAPCPRR